MHKRLECKEGASSKFWEVEVNADQVVTRWGRLGTAGQSKSKAYASPALALKDAESQLAAKLKSGYQEAVLAVAAAPLPPQLPEPAQDLWAPLRKQAWPWREWAGELGPCPAPRPGKLDLKVWEMGLGVVVPSLFEAQRTALALLRDQPVNDDPTAWAALLVMAPQAEDKVLRRAGLRGLTQAYLQSLPLQSLQEKAYHWLSYKEAADSFHPVPDLQLLQRIRHRLALAPAEEYRQVVHWAERERAGASLDARCVLAALLPDQGWAEEEARACLQVPTHRWGYRILPEYSWALLPSLRDADLAGQLCASSEHIPPPASMAPSLLANLQQRAYPLIFKQLSGSEREAWASCLWEIEDGELAVALKAFLEDRLLRPKLAAYYEKFPSLGVRALAQVVVAGGKSKETARVLLTQLLRSLTHLPPLEARELTLCQQLQARLRNAQPEAELGEWPPVLAEPPWLSSQKPPAPLVAQAGALSFEAKVHEATGKAYFYNVPPPEGMKDEAAFQRLRRALEGGQASLSDLDGLTDGRALALWLETPPRQWHEPWDGLKPLLARFGLAGLPGFLRYAERNAHLVVEALHQVESPQVAPLMARALQGQKSRKLAASWLLAYPQAALIGLIGEAVGADARRRGPSEEAVRFLVRSLGSALALELAAQMGVEPALRQVLEFDPLFLLPARLPKLPPFLDPQSMPRPLLHSGKALPLAAVTSLLTMLAFSPLDPAYAGVEQVRQACQADSLEEFVWELYSLWNAAGGPAKEKWMFQALALLGGDEVARRLGPLVRAWPHENLSARAEQGLELLSLIGTDVALMHIYQMSQKLKSKSLQEKARLKLEEIAARRGLSREELADRLVSDLDLEADGSCLLDFGERSFRVSFDAQLKPLLFDSEGKALKDLPKARGERAEAATRRWKALKQDAKTLAQAQLLRLELAMSGRRRWNAQSWELCLLRHPLLAHLVRRLLWGVYAKDRLLECFRVAEDGTLADRRDEPYRLEENAWVGIPHPLELEVAELQSWAQLFSDYDILQPFPQLGRAVHRLRAGEESALEIVRQQGRKVHPGKLLGLEHRGWLKGEAWDSGCCVSMRRPASQGGIFELEFHDGIFLGAPHESGDQELGVLKALRHGQPGAWGQMDPMDISEVLADLEGLQ